MGTLKDNKWFHTASLDSFGIKAPPRQSAQPYSSHPIGSYLSTPCPQDVENRQAI